MRGLPKRVFDFYWGEGIADDVPALTYYLLLSLAPFALGIAALEALLLDDLLSAIQVAGQLNRFLPDAVHEDVERLVIGTRDNSPLLLGVAVVAMLWTSSGAIGVVERVESRMLDCPRHNVVVGRVRNLVLGALVALTVVAASAGAPVIGDAAGALDLREGLPDGLVLALNGIGSVIVFAVIFRYAPRSRLRWRSAFIGALPAGLALQAVPAVVGLYFGAAAGFAAVRVFLLLAVLLLGLYVMALVILVGAGVAVRAEQRRRHAKARRPLAGVPRGLLADADADADAEDRDDRARVTPPAAAGAGRPG
jgi:membrane protein